ncbi:MAG TPA: spermidine/putrescine ABC transporter substrate-binding protein [Opitutaceae bacterium]
MPLSPRGPNVVARYALQAVIVVVVLAVLVPYLFYQSWPVLNLYIWDGYFPTRVLLDYQATHHVRLRVTTYSSNDELLAHTKVSWGEYDVVMPSNYMVQDMRRYHLLTKIDKLAVPNMANLSPDALNGNVVPPGDEFYGVPYLRNYAGIGYRKSAVPSPPTTWADFFSAASARQYGFRLSLLDEPRESIGLALVSLGFSPNTRDETQLAAVRALLDKQARIGRPTLVLENGRSLLEDGVTSLLASWSPEVALAQQENSHIGYVMPADGSIMTVDTLSIPVSSNHQALAMDFINYCLRPDVARKVTEFSGYPNMLKASLAPPPINMATGPSFAVPPAGKSFVLSDVGDAQYLYDAIWVEYTTQDDQTPQ